MEALEVVRELVLGAGKGSSKTFGLLKDGFYLVLGLKIKDFLDLIC
jgi:hypothetical protein